MKGTQQIPNRTNYECWVAVSASTSTSSTVGVGHEALNRQACLECLHRLRRCWEGDAETTAVERGAVAVALDVRLAALVRVGVGDLGDLAGCR